MDGPCSRIHDNDGEGYLAKPRRYSVLSGYISTSVRLAKSVLIDVSCALLPSFVLGRLRASSSSRSPGHTRYTSALDGIRGLACIAVMNYHILWVYQPRVHYGYALTQEDLAICIQKPEVVMRNDSFLQLPIIRLPFSATGSVSAFFIIAGFVLAYKPLALSRQGRWQDVLSTLASSTFRRGIRLYLPTVAASSFSFITFCLGWWQYRDVIMSWDQISSTELSEPTIARQRTLLLQILDWLQDLSMMINNWNWAQRYPRYNVHLWTISSEYRASMVVFLTLPVYVMIRKPFRMIIFLLIIFYAYIFHRWEVALFLSGILLADMSQARQVRSEERSEASHQPIFLGPRAPRPPIWRAILKHSILGLLLTLALYTLSAPDFCLDYTPGYRLLSRLRPQRFESEFHLFYPSFGALLLVFLVSYNSPDWFLNRYILNSSATQYFGRISFSLYVVHGPLLHIVGYRLFTLASSLAERDSLLAYSAGLCIAYGIFFALVVWTADVFWRVVDVRSVRFARSLEQYVMYR
ncbi:hypothetical protein IMSHALPRED_006494 [Imshaugia aleurites]|uniref:Acyltransferase 3 domain-containing protein n=1 Tax=Imshaugia aleurites TaxID=172621 RepID=A0A8H3EJN6_9LECA|nr:hypothetical protein IMSHALPRED_006494 [Imshaugia aleurites]